MGVLKFLWKLEEYFVTVTLAIMATVTFGAVVSRFSFHYPLPWSEELVRYLFCWTSMVGSSIAIRNGAHIGINLVTDRLPAKVKSPVLILSYLFAIGFCVMLFMIGYQQMMAQSTQLSPALEVNMAFVYASVPVGSVLMIISFIVTMVRELDLRPAVVNRGSKEVQ
ncbi:MAG: Tripartite ATP-independent periplasmic transporter DctQ component [Peptococcaceae bacterium]|jgi:TRAP-type C4-dicarboxylate transport system permease small subunit|nr:Tripartite ATP-independent periplasmic transporter DctQ component [Peptococcaceae bacterium]